MNFPTPNSPAERTHAVVIGGSIAGLLAGRILTDYFDKVTIIERDLLPQEPQHRSGVPQSHHLHSLLTRGYRILEQLFPGLTVSLIEQGALEIDWIGDLAWLMSVSDRWTPRFPSGITTCLCSRNLLEFTIRRHLTKFSQVNFLEAAFVTGLLINSDKTAIKGVKVKVANKEQIELAAQLVVDASGRNSCAPKWLGALGYEMPEETRIHSFLGYASRLYQCPQREAPDWKLLYVMPSPPNQPRGGMIFPLECDRWIVTLAGMGKDYPPTQEKGFLEFARSLRSEVIYQTITKAQPLSSIYGYRNTENRLRHYEKLKRIPENFLVLGDAVCSLTPIYGQGMTVAALNAVTLNNCLKQQLQNREKVNLKGLSRRFQQQIAQVNQTPWLISTSYDLRWATTIGGQPDLITQLIQKYLDQVMKTAVENNTVHLTLIEVMSMLKPPMTLFAPSILLKVGQHQLQNLVRRKTTDDKFIHHIPPMRST